MPFINYYLARLEDDRRTFLYRDYVATSLQVHPKTLIKGYREIVYEKYNKKEEKSAEQIARETMQNAGLKFRE